MLGEFLFTSPIYCDTVAKRVWERYMGDNTPQVVQESTQSPKDDTDRDQTLRHIVNGKYRPPSPRSLFERANEYVPTRVRAANMNG